MFQEEFECTSTVKLDKHNFKLTWNIYKEVFETLTEDSNLNSMTFKTNFCNSSWHIQIKSAKYYSNYYGIFLCLEKADQEIEFSYSYVTKAGEKIIGTVDHDWDWKGG